MGAEKKEAMKTGWVYAVVAGWPAGLLRAQTSNAAPRRTRVCNEPQMQRVQTVTPDGLRCRETVVTGSSSGQPQNGQHCMTASS
ncbi:hypothetical protein K3N28_09420 [Glycomyces sp. TRM65418]|uniref:hypothetical protein n=1 Tax=Glycomyces sp. TRM65418 TaxID=2867006 RepID=UPI001CE627CE|nr:hypothetical protein [Glycomyces sp. TRM65418]MCC3763289.1 hypothetical protein [Glycomyces sp. TRM65418]QZD57288.1 hypothetical protein K3N28_09360 [Glycomyces sp. TRM65418]